MWNSNLSNWKNVPTETYKFFYESGEKRLKEILDEAEKITSRSYSMIGLTIPVLSLSIAELIKNYERPDVLTLLAVLAIVVSGFILYKLIQIVNVRDVWYLGTEPEKIVTDDFTVSNSLSQDELTKALYLSEIEQIQHKVSSNKNVNNQRIDKFKSCVKLSLFSLITLITILFIQYVFKA